MRHCCRDRRPRSAAACATSSSIRTAASGTDGRPTTRMVVSASPTHSFNSGVRWTLAITPALDARQNKGRTMKRTYLAPAAIAALIAAAVHGKWVATDAHAQAAQAQARSLPTFEV